MSEVTGILERAKADDPKAAEDLVPLVYDELRKLAAVRIAQEPPGQIAAAPAATPEKPSAPAMTATTAAIIAQVNM